MRLKLYYMMRHDKMTRTTAGLVALFAFLVAGCSDLPSADSGLSFEDGAYSKFHHAHLLNRTTTDVADKGRPVADNVSLIVGFSSPDVEAQRVVSRWRIVRRWRVVSRWTYRTSFAGVAISVPRKDLPAFLEAAENDPDIAWVQPDFTMRLPYQSTGQIVHEGQITPWGIPAVGADRSSAASGDGVETSSTRLPNIFLLDTGAANADLNIVYCAEIQEGSVLPCRSTHDSNGHGTEVIGFAAARDNAQGIVGVAPGAPVYVLKVLNDQGEGDESDVIAAIDYLTQYKLSHPGFPMLVNMSLGADAETTSYVALDLAVAKAIEAGITFVVAAGNDSRDASTYTPAHVEGAITVGAYSKAGNLAQFSNYGSAVDILAPGENIEAVSTGSYEIMASGTSHAPAWVTGAAALFLANNPNAAPAQVHAAIVESGNASIHSRPGTTNLGVDVSGF